MENSPVDRLTISTLVSANSLETLIQGYLLNCRCENKSPKTVSIYRMVLDNFQWFLSHKEMPTEVHLINALHVREFLWYLASEKVRWGSTNSMATRPANSTTVHVYYRSLKTFFSWLKREELINKNPFDHINPPKQEKKVIQALSVTEINTLFDACLGKTMYDVRDKAILCVLLDSGLRISELTSLKVEDFDQTNGTLFIRRGKGGKQRIVRVGSRAQKALWKYLTLYRKGSDSNLFLNKTGHSLDANAAKLMFRRLENKTKIEVHPHKLRHTFAISFLRAGGDVFNLQYLLGHTTLQMTQRYLQSLNSNDAVEAHKKFSPLDNLYV
ncbi:integrase/recombinase XerC [Dehalogenimonas formicexedens]|uniref:Integrase/recombinase XerC n=1 Tax=Dehalogenimonas formicexedens TaxID=1839801 RepID=A0A1P8F5H8_9CHLR|nr:tyrosine-type recombinase/integrase [Dehalogenimonas formicexedens]APV43731.1 integrase/recombinase XerC [Dehalogenimonas formicexedens]